MMRKILNLFLVLVCIAALAAGCGEQPQKEVHYCAKCGREATSTISGPLSLLQKDGIPASACRRITGDVYSAYICGSCTGPVATITPD